MVQEVFDLLSKAKNVQLAKIVSRLVKNVSVLQKTASFEHLNLSRNQLCQSDSLRKSKTPLEALSDEPDLLKSKNSTVSNAYTNAQEQQRKAIAQLKTLSLNQPLGMVGYVTACCVAKTRLTSLWEYQNTKSALPDSEILQAFYKPSLILSLIHTCDVVSHLDSLASMAPDFPDIIKAGFKPRLYDVINDSTEKQPSLSFVMAQKLYQEYQDIQGNDVFAERDRARVLDGIRCLADKGYPDAQILDAHLLIRLKDELSGATLLQQVLRNPFATNQHVALAKKELHMIDSSFNRHFMKGLLSKKQRVSQEI